MGPGDLSAFRSAGRALFSLGLVKASEGNLSTWDGQRLVITRTGCRLADLAEADVLEGTLEAPPPTSSSDLGLHLAMYREHGPGAVAHAHPPGSVPDDWAEGEPHGAYAHAATLDAAVERLVARARGSA